jgi:hypothetical protein
MGQGHYNAIGFGCLYPEALKKKLAADWKSNGTLGDDFYDLVSTCGGRTGYESKPDYIAIFLADSGRDHVTMSPTCALNLFTGKMNALVTPAVIARWERLRKKAMQKFGIDLPAGQLLFIADYD